MASDLAGELYLPGIVEKYLRKKAAPEEIAYLHAHIPQWRIEVMHLQENVLARIARLQQEMNEKQNDYLAYGKSETQSLWFQFKVEQEEDIRKAKSFLRKTNTNLAEIRSLERERGAKRLENRDDAGMKHLYCQGWTDALYCLHMLMKEGNTYEQAYGMCVAYSNDTIRGWRRDTTMPVRPIPRHPLVQARDAERVENMNRE